MIDSLKMRFGLLGRNISYSFSKGHFTEKFKDSIFEGYTYENFDIEDINYFTELIKNNPDLRGLNVTIPYKEAILPFLDKLSKKASVIGAVNTIKFTKSGKLKGYNTDYYGFKKSLEPLLQPHHTKALILGTGGAAKGVAFALDELGILYTFVSRENKEKTIRYDLLNETVFENHTIIINTTPLGTSPNTDNFPTIPYEFFTEKHIAYDLIYNPAETVFLKKAKKHGAQTKNGLEMLILQAEKAWRIWNK
ncbi:shikimate dehydrogenase family protein [Flavobacterium polysaccharolyticum]|uniref:Shikimate dehydrogenase n=1 Tax=Flavobacterium polysaccharolyticum TaxID=3133148 RepID=A0ABU9NLZ7_9FLAO